MRRGEQPPWIVPDGLWQRIEPLLPKPQRNPRYPGRKRIPDRQVLCGILFVLHTGIQWEFLPQELGFGSGMTCWRRLEEWNRAGVSWVAVGRYCRHPGVGAVSAAGGEQVGELANPVGQGRQICCVRA
ncbi:transposase [Micromonospora sp. ATA51]|nr:transposase [Micromonospora sp. ATA51]